MSKKLKKILITVLAAAFAAVLAFAVAACTNTTVSVTFDANGGEFEGGKQSVSVEGNAGEELKVPQDPARGGFNFIGWASEKDGDPVGVPEKIPEESQTYYACWIPEGEVAVTFDANGGNFAGNTLRVLTGKPGDVLVPPQDPTREGFSFSEWSSTKNGTLTSVPMVFPDHNLTFYAIWQETGAQSYTLTVTYGIRDGRVGAQTTRVRDVLPGTSIAGALAEVDPASGDSEIVFDGWYYADGTKLAEGAAMPAENLTLRAKYTVAYTLTVSLQEKDGETYGEPSTTTERGFYGERFTYQAPEGFETDARHEGSKFSSERLDKGETFTVFAARRRYTVTFTVGGNGVNEARDFLTLWYGAEYVIPSFETTSLSGMVPADVFVFSWTTAEGDTLRAGDTLTVSGAMTVRGDISFGKTDIFGGDDHLFVDGDTAFLRRGALERMGSFDRTTGVFRFENGGKEVLGGVAMSETFYFYNDTTEKDYVDFFGGAAKLRFLYHGEAEYTPAGSSSAASGKLTVSEETGRYTFTPADGGDSVEFTLDVLYDAHDVPHPAFRTESEHEEGAFARLEDKSDPYGYDYTVLVFDGFGYVTEYYDPTLADSSDEYEREFFGHYNGSVGRYYRYTDELWAGAEYYTIEFPDGDSYTVELTFADGLPALDNRPLAGTWFAYDGMLGEGDYLVGVPIAGGRAAGFCAGINASNASLILDGFGNALLDLGATYDETNCTYADLHWTGTYVIRSEVVYGYGLDGMGAYTSATMLDWIEYTDSETGEVTLYSFDMSYRTYAEMASAPKRYTVAADDLSIFGTSVMEEYFYKSKIPFTEVLFLDVRGDATEIYIYGRRDDAPIWSATDGREIVALYEPIEAGVATHADGVYTFTSSSQTPTIATMRFTLNEVTMTVDVLSGAEEPAEEQIITDEETGEVFRLDESGAAYYQKSESDEEVEITAHRDTLGEEDDDFETGEQYAVWRSGFYRFDLPDGTTAYFTYRIEEDGSVTYTRIEEPTFYTLTSASYLDRPELEIYFYKTDDGKYYLGYMPDDGYTFWAGETTPIEGIDNAFTFVMQETFRETFEYYTGVSTENLRLKLSESDHTFVLYDGTLTATDSLTNTTMSTDGFGTLTLTVGGEETQYPYALRDVGDGKTVLVYATYAKEYVNDDGLTIGQAEEHYIIVDTANNTFVFAEKDAGVYYAASLTSGGVGIAQYAFELDGDGHVILSEPNVAERRGTYEETGTLANSATMLSLVGFEYDLTLYTFTFTDEEGNEDKVDVAAFHTNELTYVMDGETYLFVPLGFFFERMPAATADIKTEDGMGFIKSDGYVSYNTIAIADAVYDNGMRVYVGTVMRGTYVNDSFYAEERDFVFDEEGTGTMLLFEAYDENNEVSDQFFFDIIEKDGVEYARLRTTDSGLYVETVGGDITNNTLLLDGYGNATLTRSGEEIEGTVERVDGEWGSYIFTGKDDNETTFKFGLFLLTANSGDYVYTFVYANDGDAAGYLVGDDWSVLYLDDYFNAYYIDHAGKRYDGAYSFLTERRSIASLTLEDGSILYFDLDFEHGSFELDERDFIVEEGGDGTLLAYTGNGSISKFPDEVKRITRNSFPYGDYISAPGTMDLNKVEVIDAHAFHFVNLGASLISGPNVREIGDYAFRQEFFDFGEYGIYHSVSAFSFPNAVSVGDYAFCGDYTVSSFVFGSALQSIGVNAFSVRQGLPVSLDLSAMTAEELAAVSIGENAFQSYYLGEPVDNSIINALVYVKDVETLVAFWKDGTWPLAFRNGATLRSAHADDLDGYDFYSFSAGKYLHFSEGRVSFIGEDGTSEPQAMYFIEEDGSVKVIRRSANDEVSYVELVRTDDIIQYGGHKYFRASNLMKGNTQHGVQLDDGVMFYFELLITRDIEDDAYESRSVRGVYVNDRSEDARIVPESYDYADGKLTIVFVYDGTDIAKGKYTVTVDLEGDTLSATYSMIDQRYVYNVEEGTSYNRSSYRILADFAGDKIEKIHMVENYNYYGLDPWDRFTVLAERTNKNGTHTVYAEGQRQNGYGVIGVLYTISYNADTDIITMEEKRDGNNMTGMVSVEFDTAHETQAPYDRLTVNVITYTAGDEEAHMFAFGSVRHFEYDTQRNTYLSTYPEYTVTEADYLNGTFTVQVGDTTYTVTTSYDEETAAWKLAVTVAE